MSNGRMQVHTQSAATTAHAPSGPPIVAPGLPQSQLLQPQLHNGVRRGSGPATFSRGWVSTELQAPAGAMQSPSPFTAPDLRRGSPFVSPYRGRAGYPAAALAMPPSVTPVYNDGVQGLMPQVSTRVGMPLWNQTWGVG